VATCQVLLNAYRLLSAPIAVDGIFLDRTQEAVRILQQQNNLSVTGRVDRETWTVLARGNDLTIHDSVDVFDPVLNEAVATLQEAGARPALVGGLCNGVGALYGQLMAAGVSVLATVGCHRAAPHGIFSSRCAAACARLAQWSAHMSRPRAGAVQDIATRNADTPRYPTVPYFQETV